MKLEIGDVVQLSDELDYAVIQKISVNKNIYLYLISTSNPLQTVIAKQREENNEILLESVSDKEELDYVLYKISQLAGN